MSNGQPCKKPTGRRYTPDEKAQARVRLVRQLLAELGTDHGTMQRVAGQLSYGIESVRSWVRQADIDECRLSGTTTTLDQTLVDVSVEGTGPEALEPGPSATDEVNLNRGARHEPPSDPGRIIAVAMSVCAVVADT
jgi:hypothetical protein